ncbi:ABC transporter substrate-binding protein [Prauserella sp. PE36]|uniref:ABC transporter substrate-binding protein n=1 Tax=Prauserella sp. PE36 TaxID=1504709 RepID=UPI000DE415DE|nr:ABC transporter substrate-binding protein [Prauserella sp. PE36]RBM21856.1 ABC transporter substrate-binding protein [Prauserella sp. PE36]
MKTSGRTSTVRRSRRAFIAAATVAILALGACSSPTASQPGGEAAELTIGIASAPRSLDPAQLDGGTQAYIWGSVYDTLLYYDNEGKLQPNAAESWEYSDDARTLTFTLRDGMTFSNGNPVTAEAVAANLERNKATPGQQQSKMSSVDSVEAPDPNTVVVRFSAPDQSFIYNMALDAGVIADPETVDEPRTPTDPVGSGPYVLDTSASVSGSSYVLKRREDYWNADAYPFATITVRVISDQAATLNALRSGEVDVSTVPMSQLDSFKSPEFSIASNASTSAGYLNLADREGKRLKPLGDLRVRQAINMAFNRSEIVDKLLFGSGSPTNQQFGLKSEAYDPDLERLYKYDPEQARKLLAEAGYPDGFDVNMPSTPVSQAFEPTISQALGDIGIRVSWDPTPAQNATAAVAAGEYPMYFFLVGSDVAPREVQRQFHSSSQNPFNWSSPEFERLEEAANREMDPARRAGIYQELNAYVVENALFAPLFFLNSNIVTAKNVKHLGDGTNGFSSIRKFDVVDGR